VIAFVIGAIITALWLGPVYELVDGCKCGRSRRWFAFADRPRSIASRMCFLNVMRQGTSLRAHSYWDAPVGKAYPIDWFQ